MNGYKNGPKSGPVLLPARQLMLNTIRTFPELPARQFKMETIGISSKRPSRPSKKPYNRAEEMANHPNRSRRGNPAANPKPDEIKAAREAASLTQTEAAQLVYTSLRAWQQWEYGERRMHPAFWELFNLKKSACNVHSKVV